MGINTVSETVDFGAVMTLKQIAALLHRSGETVRVLTEREWHPLPCINTGMGKKKQRLFRRTSVLRWLEEEEHGAANEPPPTRAARKDPTNPRAAQVQLARGLRVARRIAAQAAEPGGRP